jgi:hypothetical protein
MADLSGHRFSGAPKRLVNSSQQTIGIETRHRPTLSARQATADSGEDRRGDQPGIVNPNSFHGVGGGVGIAKR